MSLDKKLVMESRFPFGKHRGRKVEDVLEDDPTYLIWWGENVNSPPLCPVVERCAIQSTDMEGSGDEFENVFGSRPWD